MRCTREVDWNVLLLLYLVNTIFCAVSCTGHSTGGNDNRARFEASLPQEWHNDLDILLVIDNSESMVSEYLNNRPVLTIFEGWYRSLAVRSRPVNIHFGVTTNDLGIGAFAFQNCTESGDRGILLGEACLPNPQVNYIIDVVPRGCNIVREYDTWGNISYCSYNDCTQENCQHEPNTSLVSYSATSCPRCLNYSGSFVDMASCFAEVASDSFPNSYSCAFKQPLGAIKAALDENASNAGFFREGAMLGIAIITDDDDCSASDTRIYDDSQNSIDSVLGYHSPFRCFEFGVSCDVNDRSYQGIRNDCGVLSDDGGYLHSVKSFVDFIQDIKDPQMFDMALLAGPFVASSVVTTNDASMRPSLQPSCDVGIDGARPAIRLSAFVQDTGGEEEDIASICDVSIEDFFDAWGERLNHTLESYRCLPAPLGGCRDVSAWWGQEGDSFACNDVCRPECIVIDVQNRGTADEMRAVIPRCVEVDATGNILPENVDKEIAYQNGKPDSVDEALPVPACWYVEYSSLCTQSEYTTIKVSRRTSEIRRAFLEVNCVLGAQSEDNCSDGIDNDQDCLTDMEDGDCQ